MPTSRTKKTASQRSKTEQRRGLSRVSTAYVAGAGLGRAKRGTKTTLDRMEAKHKKDIEASVLYPIAKIVGTKDGQTVDLSLHGEHVFQCQPWYIRGRGDGDTTLQTVSIEEVPGEKDQALLIDCKLSKEKLKGALVFFGPQSDPGGVIWKGVSAGLDAFPKKQQTLRLPLLDYERLTN